MRVGGADRPHFDEAHAVAPPEELVRAFDAGEAAADHGDARCRHPPIVGAPAESPSGGSRAYTHPVTFEGQLYDRDYFEGLHKSHWFTNPPRKYEERNRDALRVVSPGPSDRILELGSARGDVTFFLARPRAGGRRRRRLRRRARSRRVRPGAARARRTSVSSSRTSLTSRRSPTPRSTRSRPSTSSSTSTTRRSPRCCARRGAS